MHNITVFDFDEWVMYMHDRLATHEVIPAHSITSSGSNFESPRTYSPRCPWLEVKQHCPASCNVEDQTHIVTNNFPEAIRKEVARCITLRLPFAPQCIASSTSAGTSRRRARVLDCIYISSTLA